MTWESVLMPAIVLATMAIGGLGAFFTLRSSNGENARRIDGLESRAGKAEADLAQHKLHASEAYVRRDDLEKLEDRIGRMFEGMNAGFAKRLDTVEHQLRNIDTRIISFLSLKGREKE